CQSVGVLILTIEASALKSSAPGMQLALNHRHHNEATREATTRENGTGGYSTMQRFAPDRLLWYSWLRSYYFDMNHHDQARAVPRSGLFLCPVLVVMGPGVPTPNPCRALFGARYLHDLKN